MCARVRACVHACVHVYAYMYMCAYVRACMYACIYSMCACHTLEGNREKMWFLFFSSTAFVMCMTTYAWVYDKV